MKAVPIFRNTLCNFFETSLHHYKELINKVWPVEWFSFNLNCWPLIGVIDLLPKILPNTSFFLSLVSQTENFSTYPSKIRTKCYLSACHILLSLCLSNTVFNFLNIGHYFHNKTGINQPILVKFPEHVNMNDSIMSFSVMFILIKNINNLLW